MKIDVTPLVMLASTLGVIAYLIYKEIKEYKQDISEVKSFDERLAKIQAETKQIEYETEILNSMLHGDLAEEYSGYLFIVSRELRKNQITLIED